jgi:hypothetical protein
VVTKPEAKTENTTALPGRFSSVEKRLPASTIVRFWISRPRRDEQQASAGHAAGLGA